jgi:hypothetical protein
VRGESAHDTEWAWDWDGDIQAFVFTDDDLSLTVAVYNGTFTISMGCLDLECDADGFEKGKRVAQIFFRHLHTADLEAGSSS